MEPKHPPSQRRCHHIETFIRECPSHWAEQQLKSIGCHSDRVREPYSTPSKNRLKHDDPFSLKTVTRANGSPKMSFLWTGYTLGMKTAVSIPDEVFEKVERLARRAGRSRSEVFSAALAEYVARHAPDEVTEAMDRVVADVGDEVDAFVSAAGRQVLEHTEW